MIRFNQTYEWHPKMCVQPFSGTHLRLMAELEYHVVDVGHIQAFEDLLHHSKTLNELSRIYSADVVLDLHQRLQSYLQSGFIRTKTNQPDTNNYHIPNFLNANLTMETSADGHALWLLSEYPELSQFDALLKKIPSNIGIAIVDDYLDPRLDLVNDYFSESNRPWLLLKLAGENAFIGPLFNVDVCHDAHPAACWQCLQQRLLANNGLRWLQYQDQMESTHSSSAITITAVPIFYNAERINQYIARSATLIQQLISEACTDYFFEIDRTNVEPLRHPVIHRPQCPCCGDGNMIKNRSLQPIILQPTKKQFSEDGGVRHIAPAETRSKLQRVISPVSGLLSHCHTLSANHEHANKIYRSGFFQCPRRLDALTHQLCNATFLYTTMGKGVSVEQSQASALSEGIERLAAQYQGDENFILAKVEVGDERFILPQQLAPFSEQQYQQFAALHAEAEPIRNPKFAEYQLYAALPYPQEQPLHWTPVWSLSDACLRYVPLSYCYANTPFADHVFSRFYHNGGAAGNTLEEAILQGLFEVIERDAIAIWWYNRVPRRAIDFSEIDPSLRKQLEHTLSQDWDFWALNISTDFAIPVIASVSQHKRSKQFCFGFGCHIDPMIACQRALTELCQITEIRERNTAPFDFSAMAQADYLFPNQIQTPMNLQQLPNVQHDDIRTDIEYCVQRASALDLDVLVLNYTRPDMVLHTAKVIVPGLCHLFPYFAAQRLYQVPVAMGLIDHPLTEAELNPQALLI